MDIWDDLYVLIPAYMCLVPVAGRVYKDHKFDDKFWMPIMAGYNLLMSLFSLYCFLSMVYVVVVKHGMEFGTNDCGLYDQDPLFHRIVELFYWSKYVEFADTLFLIVKKKQVSNLHFFHHCGAALNMGLLHKTGMEAAFLFVGLNSFVHTIMYFYYLAALMKIKLRGKSMITTMQIVQFLTGFRIFWQYKDIPCFANDEGLMFTFVYTYSYVGVVLLLFLNFYVQNYILKKPKNKLA